MKFKVSCTGFEALPASAWRNFRRAVESTANLHGIPLDIEEDLSVRDAEARFTEWLRRPTADVE